VTETPQTSVITRANADLRCTSRELRDCCPCELEPVRKVDGDVRGEREHAQRNRHLAPPGAPLRPPEHAGAACEDRRQPRPEGYDSDQSKSTQEEIAVQPTAGDCRARGTAQPKTTSAATPMIARTTRYSRVACVPLAERAPGSKQGGGRTRAERNGKNRCSGHLSLQVRQDVPTLRTRLRGLIAAAPEIGSVRRVISTPPSSLARRMDRSSVAR
jgi:hypothetical protein